ncbi:2998_t:CDS:1 [Paraglomus occultum]|uniref:2998_t:CDS:1 n=1 Tax=Paraglomus occultum TaxID=144539 RepID=A0A9N9DIU3_9GLOM|nr:2998_t:CDS:1 [Paraglomus occultum]
MEVLDNGYECLSLQESAEVKKAIKDAVTKMHNAGFVHGDLRHLNILRRVRKDSDDNNTQIDIKIVDYDWAGRIEHETTVYPSFLNPGIRRHPGVRSGCQIQFEHDDFMIALLTM